MHRRQFTQWLGVYPCLQIAAVCVPVLRAMQSGKSLSFEVASVKPVIPGAREFDAPLKRIGDRVTCTASRRLLVTAAYGLAQYQIAGLRYEDTLFKVEARADPNATEEQVRMMLQSLLAERFQLSAHFETRSEAGYKLVPDKRGVKLRVLQPTDKTSELPEFLRKLPKRPTAPPGQILSLAEGNAVVLVGRRVNAAKLCETLSSYFLSAPVWDRTGLDGDFDVDLRFQSPRQAQSTEPTDLPSLFEALREQLGLSLEKETADVRVLVVDRMDRMPAPN
jgi:uncharacterized protein (TIGR03435 family)